MRILRRHNHTLLLRDWIGNGYRVKRFAGDPRDIWFSANQYPAAMACYANLSGDPLTTPDES